MKNGMHRPSYSLEALLVLLDQHEQLIGTIEKEIYDNIGQVLCLVRIQLSCMDFENRGKAQEQVKESGILIARAIRDLRNLVKQAKGHEERISATR
ncbi:MAG: hypothetical protein H7Y01_09025 [Ferruginibacter sp.]|nr:hypothetical protein [Chitinophagaceae bacterium]